MKQRSKDQIGTLLANTIDKNPKTITLIGTLSHDRKLFEVCMNAYEEAK
jgi:hypothetical protein